MKCHLLEISNIGTLVKNVLGNFGLKISLIPSKCYKLVGQIPDVKFQRKIPGYFRNSKFFFFRIRVHDSGKLKIVNTSFNFEYVLLKIDVVIQALL